MGYEGFKIHGWGGSDAARDIDREVANVHAVGERVGDEMDLMLDPACEYETYGDAITVGKACDEQDYFWYEDPFRDAGISQHAHRKLSERLDTPILQTEHIRGLEPHADFVANDGTDFVRADPEYDGGITGAMKIARVAEGFGTDVEYHAPGPAQRQCLAATRNSNYYELALVHPDADNPIPPVYKGGYSDALDTVDDRGRVSVPEGPGLGVDYDWEYIEANATGSRHVYE
jgi:L-alanine-DL-glutamate epimerase-like enolase superfamily enzyme